MLERVISDRIWSDWVELQDWIGLDRFEVDEIASDKRIRSSFLVFNRIGSVFNLLERIPDRYQQNGFRKISVSNRIVKSLDKHSTCIKYD